MEGAWMLRGFTTLQGLCPEPRPISETSYPKRALDMALLNNSTFLLTYITCQAGDQTPKPRTLNSRSQSRPQSCGAGSSIIGSQSMSLHILSIGGSFLVGGAVVAGWGRMLRGSLVV